MVQSSQHLQHSALVVVGCGAYPGLPTAVLSSLEANPSCVALLAIVHSYCRAVTNENGPAQLAWSKVCALVEHTQMA